MKETDLPKVERIEPVKYGDAVTIVGSHFAEGVGNDDLVGMAQELGLEDGNLDSAKKAITATGFTRRYFHYSPVGEKNQESLLERTSDIGSHLLNKVLAAKGWQDGIDLFIDTSAFLPIEVNDRVISKSGLPKVAETKSYRYACAGAVGALIDVLSDDKYKNARVVIGAMEPLSFLLSKDQFLDPQKIAFPSIFGDAFTFMAVEPKRFKLFNKQILIQPDGGVIRLETMYSERSASSENLPGHYRFKNNGENIFTFNKNGAFLQIETPEAPSKVSMDGMATGFFFGDQTTALLIELVNEYGDKDILKSLGGQNLIMHSASKPVVDRIAKLLRRSPSYKYLDEPNLPFLMDVAGYSNGSSATTLNRLKYMIENDMLNHNLPVVWLAPGIGSAIAGAIGAINP